MIEMELAQQLREAGLDWSPAKHDNFVIPNSGLGDQIFSLNDQTILIQSVNGEYAVTFHGSVEWALDHVMLTDVVWLPSETQLREAIQLRLGGDTALVALEWSAVGYHCTIRHLEQQYTFDGRTADHAYANALLFLLRLQRSDTGPWVKTA